MNNTTFEIKNVVKAINVKPLMGNQIAPPLELEKEYLVVGICLDKQGNQHLDVGLKSVHNYITSYETDEELPDGNKIHWCHPSRFVRVTQEHN
jgi:hypothetical protein